MALRKLRNQAAEKVNYYKQRLNVQPTAKYMYVRWKTKKAYYDDLIAKSRALTSKGVKEAKDMKWFVSEMILKAKERKK